MHQHQDEPVDLVRNIMNCQQQAQPLEPDKEEREKLQKSMLHYAENFLEQIDDHKAYQVYNENIFNNKLAVGGQAKSFQELLSILKEKVDSPGLNPGSGGHLGYIPGGGLYFSALADYLADIFNRYSGVYFAGPGAVHLENELIAWMAKLVAYPADAVGNLSSGGSIANLIAVTAAREAFHIQSADVPKMVIYFTQQAHHSINKAIRISGMQECVCRYIPMDEQFRMDTHELAEKIKTDKANRLRPWIIFAAAGTTDTGAIDDLPTIADIAEQDGIWFHVDAAYGGFFLLTEKGKKLLKGIELSDSVVMDPHKGLFLPYGLGAVIIKNKQAVMKANAYHANYMQDAEDNNFEISPADLSPELSKHFRGLRLWLPLQLLGIAPFKAALEEKLLLAQYFYENIRQLGFETGPAPQLSVVIFRYVPEKNAADQFNKAILDEMWKDGRIFLSSTSLNDHFYLRICVLSFRTHMNHIELALTLLSSIKDDLLKQTTSSY